MRSDLRHILPVLILLVPAGAQADLACRFVTECFEAEACDETDFALSVTETGAPGAVLLGSVSDDVTGTLENLTSGARIVQARGASSLQLLSIGPDGAARYTLHLTDGPAVLSYLGTCEEPK